MGWKSNHNDNVEALPFYSKPKPKYLGAMLGRSLTFCRHLPSLRKKLTSLLRQLASLGKGAGATTSQTATLVLIHSTAECCAPVWCCSAQACLIYPAINDALWTVTGCLHPTPADNLPVLAGILHSHLNQPPCAIFYVLNKLITKSKGSFIHTFCPFLPLVQCFPNLFELLPKSR